MFYLEDWTGKMQSSGDSDEKITMLLSMGFSDIEYVRKALTLAKNDLNEAVAILTGEDSRGEILR